MKGKMYLAFSAGLSARRAELAMTSNPFGTDTAEQRKYRAAWLNGWETEDRFIRIRNNDKTGLPKDR
jgi:hypothetical protein